MSSYIDIAYRNEFGKTQLGGPLYDHLCLRLNAQYTCQESMGKFIITEKDPEVKLLAQKTEKHHPTRTLPLGQETALFNKVLNNTHFSLPRCGEKRKKEKIYPIKVTNNLEFANSGGLLFLPGMSRQMFESQAGEDQKEKYLEIIQHAKRLGKPILAVCAASWILLESYGGTTAPVENHCSRMMPRITPTKRAIGWDVQLHSIKVGQGSMLDSILREKTIKKGKKLQPIQFEVNSVHWRAPDEAPRPNKVKGWESPSQICGNAIAIPEGPKKPPSKSCEGFESCYGAPVLGIVWHPETGYSEQSRKIIQFAAQAGDAYIKRRALALTFKQQISQTKSPVDNLTDLFNALHISNADRASAPV